MGYRTREINLIKEKKNQIVRAYFGLKKNSSSYFDALATSYGSENIKNIISKFGLNEYGVVAGEKNSISQKIALTVAKNAYNKNFLPMEIYSSIYTIKDGCKKQQKYVCLANRNVDRKRKFDFETLFQYINNNDIVLLRVKEREISAEIAELLDFVDIESYNNQALNLLLKTMPTIDCMGKSQNAVIMHEVKKSSPKLYNELLNLNKKISQRMFMLETSKEQLLLNDAIEEFQSKVYSLNEHEIKNNFNEVNIIKTKADRIAGLMESNNDILQKYLKTRTKILTEKGFYEL